VAYSIADFAKSLRLDKCKIKNRPDLIFLCGGILPPDANGPFVSARDFFYRYLLDENSRWTTRIKLAEKISAWFRKDEAFPDLLQLENYLAGLAAATILFVESPGSIAELGAFAASDALRPKTLAVLNTFFDIKNSFIADGPAQRIKGDNPQHVLYYEWNPTKLNSAETQTEFTEIARALIDSLRQEDAARKKLLSFDAKETGDTLLLVADLIRIAGVASKSDLADCLQILDLHSTKEAVDRYLSILQSIDFVVERRRSNQIFYVRGSSTVFVRYAYFEVHF
jgi:hypothetical protein